MLTTARMVLINTESNPKWYAFDIPLALMSDDKFEQPIFGANYIRGKVQPMYGLIPGPASYKIWFMNGGCSKFLKAYHHIVDKVRAAMHQPGHAMGYAPQFSSGNFQENFVAFADANDPSVLYVSQPPVADKPQPMQAYINGQPSMSAPIPPRPAPSYVPPPNYAPAPNYGPPPSYAPPPTYAPQPGYGPVPAYPPPQTGYQQAPGMPMQPIPPQPIPPENNNPTPQYYPPPRPYQ